MPVSRNSTGVWRSMRATMCSSTADSAPRLDARAMRPRNRTSMATVRTVAASRSPSVSSSAAARAAVSASASASIARYLRSRLMALARGTIECRLERLLAGSTVSRKKVLAPVLADRKVGLDYLLDGVGDLFGREAWAQDVADLGIVLGAAAKRDLVVLRTLLVDAEDADVAGVMMPAGIDAAR